MCLSRIAAIALSLILAATLLASSGGQSDARWHDSLTLELPDGQADAFTSMAADLDSPRAAVMNNPTISVSNTSETQQGWVDLRQTEVLAGRLGGQQLASALGMSYTIGSPGGDCTSGAAPYWDARQEGQITLGMRYRRDEQRVDTATLSPQQSRPLCLQFPRTSADSDFLRNNAGRDLRVRTQLSQRSEPPATWRSAPESVDSRLKIAFPRPMPRNDDPTDIANSCAVGGRLAETAELRWAWPDPAGSSEASTPAVEGWEIWGRSAGRGNWEQQQVLPGTARTARVDTELLAMGDLDFKIIARLDPARDYWVESTHIITVGRLTGLMVQCTAVRANDQPNPGGPVVLP